MKILRLIPATLVLLASSLICSCDDNDDEISDLEERVESIEERVTALENLCSEMNTNIASLQTLVSALENNDYITSIVEVTKDGEVIGYTITFLYSDPITIYNGSDGADGTDGADGADGSDGITPQLKIENDYWYVSYDNGSTWTCLGSIYAEDSSETTDCIFSSVDISDDYVTFILADGTTFELPIYKKVEITFEADEEADISGGETISISYNLTNATDDTKLTVSSDGNYKVSLDDEYIYVTAPDTYTDGYINVLLNDGNGYTTFYVISFYERQLIISGEEVSDEVTYAVTALGGEVEIPVSVNFDYEIEIPSSASDWVSASVESRATMRNESIILNVGENTSLSARSCTLNIIPTNSSTTYLQIVIQQSASGFSIDNTNLVADADGETLVVTVQSGLGLSVDIPSDDTWVTSSTSFDGTDYELSLIVAENSSSDRRYSTVSLYSEDGSTLLTEVEISQYAADEDSNNDLVFLVSANPSNNYTVYLPILYSEDTYAVDCIVDWGDGTKEHVKNTSEIYHEYSDLSSIAYFDVSIVYPFISTAK